MSAESPFSNLTTTATSDVVPVQGELAWWKLHLQSSTWMRGAEGQPPSIAMLCLSGRRQATRWILCFSPPFEVNRMLIFGITPGAVSSIGAIDCVGCTASVLFQTPGWTWCRSRCEMCCAKGCVNDTYLLVREVSLRYLLNRLFRS
jgi:hypothetical protein